MRAFIIVALAVAVSGEADPYTIGQVLAGQTNGGVITSTTYDNGVKVAGFPYTGVHAVAPVAAYSAVHAVAPVAAVHHAVAPVAAVPAVHAAYSAYPYASYPYNAYGKREAEPYTINQIAHGAHIANAAAEGRAPGVITNAAIAPAVHAAYSGYPYAGVYSAASVAPVHAAYSAYPYASYPYHAYGKREAEAEAQFGVYPYHNLGVAGVHAGAYSAYPYASYPYHAYGKREAEAEPYTVGQVLAGHTAGGVITSTTYAGGLKVAGFPYTGVHAVAPVAAVRTVAPVGAIHAVPAVHAAYSAYPYASYPYHAYGKREAEAEAQFGVYPYHNLGVAGVHAGVYAAAPHAGVYAAAPHAVAATPFGLTHSSNVGVCTNYVGVQVPC